MKLSILVPTVPRRLRTFFPSIIDKVESQIGDREIEVLGFYDNKKRTTGAKRNTLLQMSRGDYITFIDDDDEIEDTYIQDIYNELDKNPDCVVYDVICIVNNGPPQHCRYGIEYEYHTEGNDWYGKPAHTHVWKREIAVQGFFPEENFGEDMSWVAQVWPLVRNQVRIDKVLYHYNFNSNVSETRS